MTTCKDCVHYNVCGYHIDEETFMTTEECSHFKNRADFVELVKAEWLYNTRYYSCSVCGGKRFNLLLGTDAEYCPYCGAKMKLDGKGKSND